MDEGKPYKLKSPCPACGEKTLEGQFDVIWCSNLGDAVTRPCSFGIGEEKTLADIASAA